MLESMREKNELSTITCLVVDDDKFSRTFIKAALHRIGVREIKEAESVEQGIEFIKTNRTDIILLDQEMPGKKGTDFVHEIKKITDETIRSTPIIMISIDTKENTVKKAKELGIDDYLAKPISPLLLKKEYLQH